ncbi:hypothetical protein Syun_030333 [Stephania yunnanensis]|uniref:BZIP domain-containing protein n=1 Tax=Stephania yunnanensis TaxID=152371 RepID=A0AAP0EFL7_9MAGN
MDKGKAPLQPEEFSTLNSFSPSPFSPLEDLFPLPTIDEHEFSEFPDFPLRDTSHRQAQSDSANFDSDKHGYADGSNGDRITNYHLPMLLDMGNTSSTLHGVKVGHEQIGLGDALMVNRAAKKSATYNRWKAMIDSLQVSRKDDDQMEFNLPKRSKGPTFNVNELMLTDPEKARRVMSNRRSAENSRERRLRYVAELEKQQRELKAQTMELMLKLAFIEEEAKDMEALRGVLKLATETMEEKVKSQDETNFALMEERQKLTTIVAAQEIIMKSQLSAMTKQIVSSSAHAHAHAMAPVVPPEQHMPLTQEHRRMLKQIEEELMEDDDTGNPTVPPNQFGGNADYGNPPEPPPSMW